MNCFVYIATDERLREQVEIRDRITDVLPSGSAQGSHVTVVSWQPKYLDALALLRTGIRVAAYKTRLTISDFYHFDSPVPVAILLSTLDEPVRSSIETALVTGGQLSAEATKALREVLAQLRPGLGEAWSQLEEMADRGGSSLWVDDREPIVAYERDAVGLALSVAGFDRNEILRGRAQDRGAPFLDGLSEFQVREDAIITHDAHVFGNWDALRFSLTGITQFQKGERELTVVNANRTKLEQTMGVDLLYYIRDYHAYVLVQYKRLRKRSRDWEFRPSADGSFAAELARMRAIAEPCNDQGDPEDHRLGDNFCFIKLCKPTTRLGAAPGGELSAGMYLPLDYFEKLVVSGCLSGPRGGVVVRYDNVGRWMSNRSFILLVERAWVGTRRLTTDQVTEMVKRALDAKHSVVLAAGRLPPPGRPSG